MSQGLSECCVTGHIHDGKPKGAVTEIAGLKTYITGPENGSKDKTILNVQILADEYAAGGFYVYVPDFFDGDPIPDTIMSKLIPTHEQAAQKTLVEKAADTATVGATLGPWFFKHRDAVAFPLIQKFLSTLRSDPVHKKIGAVGYCWGGRFAILLTHTDANPAVDAAVALHPSSLSLPSEVDKIARPVAVEVGDSDDIIKMPDVEKIQEIFKSKDGCEVRVYEDQVHGFSVRSDLSIEKDKKAKEKACEEVIKFLRKNLA